jgi:hypothetical protein
MPFHAYARTPNAVRKGLGIAALRLQNKRKMRNASAKMHDMQRKE